MAFQRTRPILFENASIKRLLTFPQLIRLYFKAKTRLARRLTEDKFSGPWTLELLILQKKSLY